MKTYTKIITVEEPRLKIQYDTDTESPREWSNLGYFITETRNYHSAEDTNDHIRLLKRDIPCEIGDKVLAIYPVYKYEHGGVSYHLGTAKGFDYSNCGFYIVTDKTVKELGTSKKDFKKVIENEINTYNKYVNGEVYGFILYDKKGEIEDSSWGYYDIEDIRTALPKEWKKEKLKEYIIY